MIVKQLLFGSRNMTAWTQKKREPNSLQSDLPASPEKDLEHALEMTMVINCDTMLKMFIFSYLKACLDWMEICFNIWEGLI